MAMAMLGGLASKFLPQLITWGAGKIMNTGFGKKAFGIAKKVKSAYNHPMVS